MIELLIVALVTVTSLRVYYRRKSAAVAPKGAAADSQPAKTEAVAKAAGNKDWIKPVAMTVVIALLFFFWDEFKDLFVGWFIDSDPNAQIGLKEDVVSRNLWWVLSLLILAGAMFLKQRSTSAKRYSSLVEDIGYSVVNILVFGAIFALVAAFAVKLVGVDNIKSMTTTNAAPKLAVITHQITVTAYSNGGVLNFRTPPEYNAEVSFEDPESVPQEYAVSDFVTIVRPQRPGETWKLVPVKSSGTIGFTSGFDKLGISKL